MAGMGNKTVATKASVEEFLARIVDLLRREDCGIVNTLMGKLSGYPPVMWGIVS